MKYYFSLLINFSVTVLFIFSGTSIADNCLQKRPTDCSIHPWFYYIAPHSTNWKQTFENACVQHDYCYRHGYATYGYSKKKCDNKFKNEMYNKCERKHNKFNPVRYACKEAAFEFYVAVDNFGDSAYKTEKSSCCEYSGPAKMSECGGPVSSPVPKKPGRCPTNHRCCDQRPDGSCVNCVPVKAECP